MSINKTRIASVEEALVVNQNYDLSRSLLEQGNRKNSVQAQDDSFTARRLAEIESLNRSGRAV
ncbi:MAG: hypothetical protein COV35_06740 [Alphaproteobacteria bacterium CG11_big_fil_rev_8_21_14_0_20_39_49]|nr:MAG: hypothetical protein COV35_06740 [Alphaproteobacteria bacterium CG11_big_fil_rev_8_21_14_0_20_39_49]